MKENIADYTRNSTELKNCLVARQRLWRRHRHLLQFMLLSSFLLLFTSLSTPPPLLLSPWQQPSQIDGEEAKNTEKREEEEKNYLNFTCKKKTENDFQLKVKRFFTIIKYFIFLSSLAFSLLAARGFSAWSREQLSSVCTRSRDQWCSA